MIGPGVSQASIANVKSSYFHADPGFIKSPVWRHCGLKSTELNMGYHFSGVFLPYVPESNTQVLQLCWISLVRYFDYVGYHEKVLWSPWLTPRVIKSTLRQISNADLLCRDSLGDLVIFGEFYIHIILKYVLKLTVSYISSLI